MKKILIAFAAAAALLCACDDDNTGEDNGSSATITISTETLTAAPEGAQQSVTVTSSGDWRLSGVCDWAHPSATSGKSGETVTFTIDPNPTESARTATFKFFTGSAVAPLTITSEIGYSLELISSAEVTTASAANQIKIELKTNIEELSTEVPEWVVYADRTDGFGKTILSFDVAENAAYVDREGKIVISSDKAEPLTIDLTQEQTNAIIIDETLLDLDLSAQDVTVVVKSNVDYYIACSADWVSEGNLVSSQKQDDGLTADTYVFSLSEATGPRGAQVYFQWSTLYTNLTVVQKDPSTELVTIPDLVFRNDLSTKGWILDLGDGACIVLENGLNATSYTFTGSYSSGLSSLEGIENFPNLEYIKLDYLMYLTKVDISKLTKVSTLELSRLYYMDYLNVGDNPLTVLKPGLYKTSYSSYMYYSYAESLTIIGSKIEDLDCSCNYYPDWYDYIKYVDVSGCPALTTLNVVRGSRLETLYLKEGQEIPNLTKSDYTEIQYK